MDDKALVALFLERDERAISASREKYGAYLFSLANNILSDPSDAEECVSSALLRAWQSMPPNRPEHLGSYLARIVRNISFNRLKARGRQKRGRGEAELVLDELAEVIPSGGDPASEAELAGLKRSVNEFIRSLPAKERNIFMLRVFHATPVSAIAERFGITENAVMSRLSRTRKKLRQYLLKEGFFDE